MIRSRQLVLSALLGTACLFCSCNKEQEQYTEMAQTFQEIKGEEWLAAELPDVAEAEALLQHYAKTKDAKYTTPKHHITLLHLACLFKKPALVLQLLKNGADPNATTIDDEGSPIDTPLRFAMSPGITEADTDDISILIINLLVKHGADTKGAISHGEGLLATAAATCDSRNIVQHLLQLAPEPTVHDLALLLERGWAEEVADVLRTRQKLTPEEKSLILAAATPSPAISPEVNKHSIDILLGLGIDINTTAPAMGETPLFTAVAYLDMLTDREFRRQWVDFIAYLLSKGADPTLTIRQDDAPGQALCAYDLLAAKPEILEDLRQRGYRLEPPELNFRPGPELPATLCRAAIRKISAQDAQPHLDTIAGIFSPTEEQLRDANLTDALLSAAEILVRTDAAFASHVINQSPIWQTPPCNHQLHQNEECHHPLTAGTLVYIAAEIPGIVIDKQKLLNVTQQAIQIHDAELAALAVELLGRCEDATAELEAFCQSDNLPICAGAWSAKLQQAGLPKATNAGVANWLAEHQRQADSPAIQTALNATSLDEMWQCQLTQARREELIQALKDVGAPQEAIAVYGQYIDNMENPEQLDKLSEQGNDWSYKLEIATAKFIFQHAQEFADLLQTPAK